ncbi:MAG: hypothetical protein ACT4N2_02875 [Hyphomicrobium sp.]
MPLSLARRTRAITRTAAAAGLALCLLGPSALADDDADDVARDIYRQVERACEGRGRAPYNLAEIAEYHFLPELRDLLADAYREHRLDFDILIDGQDCNIRDVDIDGGDDDSDHSIARAEFKNFGRKRVVDLYLVRKAGQWLVADIAYRHRKWSLRRDLGGDRGK